MCVILFSFFLDIHLVYSKCGVENVCGHRYLRLSLEFLMNISDFSIYDLISLAYSDLI